MASLLKQINENVRERTIDMMLVRWQEIALMQGNSEEVVNIAIDSVIRGGLYTATQFVIALNQAQLEVARKNS